MDNIQGNVSTIATMIWVIIAPYISQYVSQEVFLAIFGLLVVIWSAYNPNSFKIFKNDVKPPYDIENPVLNDEYECDDGDGC